MPPRPSPFEEQIEAEPDFFPWTEEAMHAMWDNPWTDKKFTFASDVQDFKTAMSPLQQTVLTRSLSAISQIEIAAVKNFWINIGKDFPRPSIGALGVVLGNNEVIHFYAYKRALKEFGLTSIFKENLKVPVIANRIKYLKKHLEKQYNDPKKQAIYRTVLFSLYVENVSLFSQFYTVKYFHGEYNWIKDTAQQVLYTAKEETVHALTGMRIVNDAKAAHPELWDDELKERIRKGGLDAYEAERQIIRWQLNGYESDRLSIRILEEMLKNRINLSMEKIGIEPIFEDIDEEVLEKSQWFENEIVGQMKTDFFDMRPVEYSEAPGFDEDDLFDD